MIPGWTVWRPIPFRQDHPDQATHPAGASLMIGLLGFQVAGQPTGFL
jgi:hypothetical protein